MVEDQFRLEKLKPFDPAAQDKTGFTLQPTILKQKLTKLFKQYIEHVGSTRMRSLTPQLRP
jgi:hypothetical protein